MKRIIHPSDLQKVREAEKEQAQVGFYIWLGAIVGGAIGLGLFLLLDHLI